MLLLLLSVARAQTVPSRIIPPSVLVEVELLENEFELALSMDCDSSRCFSKGCQYVEHAVADRPRSKSLPGLGQDPGPGSDPPQEYLTQARCSYAHEEALETADVQALNRRLQAQLSSGWTVVTGGNQALQPLPDYLREPHEPEVEEPEAPEEVVIEEPEPWTPGHELWEALLPHFFWMVGLVLATLSAWVLLWAWRRVGRISPEEQALLAQLAQPDEDEEPPVVQAVVEETPAADRAWVLQQEAVWETRLEEGAKARTQTLIRELLSSGDLPLLAKAVLRFEGFTDSFPSGSDVATTKLEFADYLRSVDEASLPADPEFFERLNRAALSAALQSQGDAAVLRSLREDFGAAGLVRLMGTLPARAGALLFALAPSGDQQEMARLLSPSQAARSAEQLLQTNRMDRSETTWLFEVLDAARDGAEAPAAPPALEATDRGAVFDAAGALSVLLGRLTSEQQATLFSGALERFNGTFPIWYQGILVAEMLFILPEEARADLLLEVEVTQLAAWLSLLGAETQRRVLGSMPSSLRATVAATSFPSRPRQLALAEQGRRALAASFQRQLVRANLAFERVAIPS